MDMKKIILTLVLIFSTLYGSNFDSIVKNFISYQGKSQTIKSKQILSKESVEVATLYNLQPNGYILVPVLKLSSPIKAYSFKSNFENLPKAYKDFLIGELYEYSKAKTPLARPLSPNSSIVESWDFLENYTADKRALKSYVPNTFLLSTSWDQDYPYNKAFPKVGNEYTVAGCVQVAMAQIMNYYKYPQKGFGSNSYKASIYQNYNGSPSYNTTLKAVFNKAYNWSIIPDTINSQTKEYQIDELSSLMFDLAILNHAKMAVDSTGATLNIQGLIEHFGYSNTIQTVSTLSTSRSDFFNTIKSQIDNSLPTLLSLPGHMVVADGYASDTTGNYIHLNMGWGGSANDFYNLDTSIVAEGYKFTTNSLDLIYNIKPCSNEAGDCYTNLESTDKISYDQLIGTFSNQIDTDKHLLYLNGETTFTPTQGSFFVNIYDSNQTLIDAFGVSKTLTLSPNLYTIKLSLNNDKSNQYFPFDSTNTDYALTLATQNLTQEQINLIDQNYTKPPQIDMDLKDIVLTPDGFDIRINAYDEDSELTLKAFSSDDINLSFSNNILHVEANNYYSLNEVVVQASSDDGIATKSFKALNYPEAIPFGKTFDIKGTFQSQNDYNEHQAILEGSCQIEGYNGYSNQAFFTSLDNYRNLDDSYITTPQLARSFYTLGASLSYGGNYYPFMQGSAANEYILHVKCPDASENISDIIPLLSESIATKNANYTPNTQSFIQNIAQGWTLDSIPVDQNLTQEQIKSYFANSKILWTYKDGIWQALGVDTQTQDLLTQNSIQKITSLSPRDGFWLYTDTNDYQVTYNTQDTYYANITQDVLNSSNKWILWGSGRENSAQNVLNAGTNIKAVWVYEQGNWIALAKDSSLQTLMQQNAISRLDTIKRGEGYWIQLQ